MNEENSNSFDTDGINTNDNKKLIYSVLFIFVVVLFYLISSGKNAYLSKYLPKNTQTNTQENLENELVSVQSFNPLKDSQNDTDGDGIENWKEITIGTDPDVANSLPDGISANNDTEKISPTTNLTNSIGRDLYVIAQYKKNDPNLNTDVMIDALNENLLDAIKPERVDILSLTDDNSAENIKSYGEKMAEYFVSVLPVAISGEITELNEAYEEKSFEKTNLILTDVTQTCKTVVNMRDIPSSFASLHTDFVYNCQTYQHILLAIVNAETDPVKSALAIRVYKDNFEDKVSSLKSYAKKLLIENKVSYNPSKIEMTNIYYVSQ